MRPQLNSGGTVGRAAALLAIFIAYMGAGCRKETQSQDKGPAQPQTAQEVAPKEATPPATPGAAVKQEGPASGPATGATDSSSPRSTDGPAGTSDPGPGEVTILEEPHKDGSLRIRREVKMGPDGKPISHGKFLEFAETGEVWKETHYRDGVKHGPFLEWYKNGKLAQLGEFKDGKMVGTWTWFHNTGEKSQEGNFDDKNQRHGTWTYWDREGKKIKEEHWEHGQKKE